MPERWDHEHFAIELDEMVAANRVIWLDRILKTDVSWMEILETMTAWLSERRSLEALQVVARALVHQGTREDLSALIAFKGMPEAAAR